MHALWAQKAAVDGHDSRSSSSAIKWGYINYSHLIDLRYLADHGYVSCTGELLVLVIGVGIGEATLLIVDYRSSARPSCRRRRNHSHFRYSPRWGIVVC